MKSRLPKGYGGGGASNMNGLMKQAQKMQEEMQKTSELLDDWEIVGTSASEAVVVYMNAKKIINGIELDESVVDPTDVEMLEDLIMAAINDGYSKADKVYEEKMAKFGGAGTLVPLTRFANAVVSPAIEFKSEGLILGTGVKMFIIAGPVLVYGPVAAVLYGILAWLLRLFV